MRGLIAQLAGEAIVFKRKWVHAFAKKLQQKSNGEYDPLRSAPSLADLKTLHRAPGNTHYDVSQKPFLVTVRGQFLFAFILGGGAALAALLFQPGSDATWISTLAWSFWWAIALGVASFILRFPVRGHPKVPGWRIPATYSYGTNLLFTYYRSEDDSFWNMEILDRYFGWVRDTIIWGVNPLMVQLVDCLSHDGGVLLKDHRFVVYQNLRIPNSNPSQLTVHRQRVPGEKGESSELSFAQDGHYIYYDGFLIQGLDCGSFALLNRHFFKDKNGIYHIHRGIWHPVGVSRVYDETDMFYQADLSPLDGVDADSFEILFFQENRLAQAKDKNRFYDSCGAPCGAQDTLRPFGPMEDKTRAAIRRKKMYETRFPEESTRNSTPPLTLSGQRFMDAKSETGHSTLCVSGHSTDLVVASHAGLKLWIGSAYRSGDRLECMRALAEDDRYPKAPACIDLEQSCAVRALATWRLGLPYDEDNDHQGHVMSLHRDGTISVIRDQAAHLLEVSGPAAGRIWIDLLPIKGGFILLDANGDLWQHQGPLSRDEDKNCFLIRPHHLQSGVLGVGPGIEFTSYPQSILVWTQEALMLFGIHRRGLRRLASRPLSSKMARDIVQVDCTLSKVFVRTKKGALWMGRVKKGAQTIITLGELAQILPTKEQTDPVVSITCTTDFHQRGVGLTCVILTKGGRLWEIFDQKKNGNAVVNEKTHPNTGWNKGRIVPVTDVNFVPITKVEALSSSGNLAILMRDGSMLSRGPFVRPKPTIPSINQDDICYARVTMQVRMKFGGPDGDWDDREVVRHFEFLPSERSNIRQIAKMLTGGRGVSSVRVTEVASTDNDRFVVPLAWRLEEESKKDTPESIAHNKAWWKEYNACYPNGPALIAEIEVP